MKKNYVLLISFLLCFAFAKAQITVSYDNSGNPDTNGDKIVTVILQEPDPILITHQAGSPSDVTIFQGSNGFIALTVAGGTPITDASDNVLINGAYNIILTRGNNIIANPSINGAYDIVNEVFDVSITNLAEGSGVNAYTVTIMDANGCTNSIGSIEIFEPEEFSFVSLDMPVTQPTCSGDTGELTIRAQGGIENYEYVLYRETTPGSGIFSNVITSNTLTSTIDFNVLNLTPANYRVIVTDNNGIANGAQISYDFTVDDIAPIVFSIGTPIPSSCFGEDDGTVTSTVMGGSGSYIFSWMLNGVEVSTNQNLTNASPGLYTLTVTDANDTNCTGSVSSGVNIVEITEPDELIIIPGNPSFTNPTGIGVPDGTVNIEVSGGTSPYEYQWTEGGNTISSGNNITDPNNIPGLSGVLAGNYTLLVTDNNMCSESYSIELTPPAPLMAIINDPSNIEILCNGDSTTIPGDVSGGTGPFTFRWFIVNGGNMTDTGVTDQVFPNAVANITYVIQVTDTANGLTDISEEITLTEPPAIEIDTPTPIAVSCFGGNNGSISTSVSGGTGVLSYEWTRQGDPTFIENTENLTNIFAGSYILTVTDENGCSDNTDPIIVSEPTNPLEITNGIETIISINGQNTGAIDITVSGGTPPYNYSWSKQGDPVFSETTEDLTNIFAGTYTVIVTDANFYSGAGNEGCTIAQTFIITEEDALLINIIETGEILCNGETTSLLSIVSGGVEPYLYQWSQEISGVLTNLSTGPELLNVQAGTYQVQVIDDNGALLIEGIIVAVVPAITISDIVAEEVKCSGELTGSININVTGGTGNLTYLWTDESGTTVGSMQDLSDVGGGNYFLSVVDENGCSEDIGPITIDDNFTPLVIQQEGLINLTGFETNNGAIDISVSGGAAPYFYAWSKDGDPTFNATTQDLSSLSEGTYNVIVTDSNDCVTQDSYTITQPELLQIVSIVETNSNLCFGNSTADLEAIVTGGVEPYTYSWFLNTTPTVELSTSNILSNRPAGTYTLLITDTNNNITEDTNIIVDEAPEIIITGITTDILCNGEMTGAIDITVSGGTPNASGDLYSYSWSNGALTEDLSNISAGTYTVTITDSNTCQSEISFTIQPAPPLLEIDTFTITNTSGFGLNNGTVSVNIIGGMPPYQYQWTDSTGTEISTVNPLENISAGTYTLIVTDSNGCTIDPTDFEIEEPDQLMINIDTSPITCNGGFGELTAIASGGVEPYTYTWTDSTGTEISTSNTSGEVIAGIYNITVIDANGNSESLSESLASIAPITIDTTITDVTCFNANDGVIVLNIQGGSGGYDISLNGNTINTTTISGLSGGTYDITVIDQNDSNCFITQSVIVDEPAQYGLNNIIVTTPSSSNNDGSISLDVFGGISPFTFVWQDESGNIISTSTSTLSNSLTGLSEGDYTLTVTDSSPFNCTITDTFTLGLPGELLLDIQQTNDVTCFNGNDGEITVTTNTGVNTYTWYDASSNPPVVIPGLVTPVIQVSAGVYFVEVFDAVQAITEISAPITITQPLAVEASITSTSNPLCFNSNDGSITINATGGNNSYEYIYRLVGTNFPTTWVNFDNGNSATITNLAEGNYEIRVRDGLGCTFNIDGTITNITASIIAPEELIIESSVITEPSGNGLSNGSVFVTITGGTPSYSYQWTNSDGIEISTTNPLENIPTGTYTLIVTDSNGCTTDPMEFEVGEPDELIVTTTLQQVILCQGEETGSINAIATGGVPFSSTPNDYTFEWFDETNPNSIGSNATIENLPAGTYFVIVTDSNNNVTISESVEIIEPPLLEVTLNADFVLCGDGNDWTIITTVTGGTGDYNYSWNTGANTPDLTNVIAGDYTVSVSDQNGCITTGVITLTPPEPLTAIDEITPTTCFDGSDGSISLTISGGSPPYEILWDTGAQTNTVDNLPAGIYQVSIIDNRGCEIINSYEISEPDEVIIDLGDDLTLCIEQTVTLDATIPDASSYLWSSSNGFESTNAIVEIGEAGTYTITATNTSGCIVTDEIIINTVDTIINAEFLVSTQVFTNEPFVIVQVSEPFPDTVEWVIPETATIIAIDDDFVELSFDTPGIYELSIIISNGLCTDIRTKEVTVIDAEEFDVEAEDSNGPIIKSFLTYPNPTDGVFTLDVELREELPISAKIYSLDSNIPIDSQVFTGNDHYIEPYDLDVSPGVYFLVLEAPNMTTLKKIIIN